MAKSSDLGFAPNYASALEIDVTPGAAKPTWAILSQGITSITPTPNETTEDKDYYGNYGVPTTKVKSAQIKYEVSGDRCYGDPAQDYIAGCALETGEGRETHYRHTHPNGDVLTGDCTLLNLVMGSQQGDASAPGAFSCTVATSGYPEYTPANKLKLPESLTVAEIEGLKVGQTAKLSPAVQPEEANPKCFYMCEDPDVASVDSDGNVTGVSAGSCGITVRCASKPSVFKQVAVEVSAAAAKSAAK